MNLSPTEARPIRSRALGYFRKFADTRQLTIYTDHEPLTSNRYLIPRWNTWTGTSANRNILPNSPLIFGFWQTNQCRRWLTVSTGSSWHRWSAEPLISKSSRLLKRLMSNLTTGVTLAQPCSFRRLHCIFVSVLFNDVPSGAQRLFVPEIFHR